MTRKAQYIRQFIVTTFYISASIVTLIYLSGCKETPDSQRITERIQSLSESIEEKSTSSAIQHLSESFSSQHIRSREEAKRYFMVSFLRYKKISIILTNIQVSIDENYTGQAVATFNAIATSRSGLLPDEGQAYRFTTDWEKLDDDWYLRKAEWKRALE